MKNLSFRISSKYLKILLVTFTLIFYSFPAQGDWFDSYITTICVPDKNIFQIIPKGTYDNEMVFNLPKRYDCNLNNGHQVRVKYGEGDYNNAAMPTSRWVSIWIDKSKVLSRFLFNCSEEEGICDNFFEVDSVGLKSCKIQESKSKIPPNERSLEFYDCQVTQYEHLSRSVDTIEYSPSGFLRPEAGTLIVTRGNEKFCSQFIGKENNYQTIVGPQGSKKSKDLVAQNSNYNIQYMSFDFNNDGIIDDVYYKEIPEGNHWRPIYFVYQKSYNRIADKWPDVSLETFSEDDNHATYPKDWKTIVNLYVLKPILFEKNTYFIGHSEISSLMLPHPDGTVSEVCTFEYLSENY